MSKASDLIAELAGEGTLEAQGQFTLDRERARDKLQRFQLAEPARYVLLIVEAAVAQGATQIEVRIDSNDVSFEFDGNAFAVEALEALWDVLLGDPLPEFPGLRPLALGLNAAMGLGPRFVRVVSGPPDEAHALELRAKGAPELAPAKDAPGKTRIHVRERLGLRTVAEFLRNLQSERDEELLLQKHCTYVSTPIVVNGATITTGPPQVIGCASLKLNYKGAHIIVGLAPSFTGEAQLERCRRGVRVDLQVPQHFPAPALAFVDDPAFALDLSHAGIRKDAHYEDVMARTDRLVFEMLAAALRVGLSVNGVVPGLSHWSISTFKALYLRSLEAALKTGPVEHHPFAGPLFRIPFFESLSGELWSINRIQVRVADAGWAGGATSKPSETLPHHERDTLYLPLKKERELLRKAFPGGIRSRDAVLSRSDARAQNKRRWQAMRSEARLGSGFWDARVKVRGKGLSGEVGLGSGDARVDLIFEGGIIQSFQPDLGIPGLVAVIEGPFTPRKTYDAVHKDQVLLRALHAILRALPELLVAAEAHDPTRALSKRLAKLYSSALSEEFGRKLFVAAGFSNNAARKKMHTAAGRKSTPKFEESSDEPSPLTSHKFLRLLGGERISLTQAWAMRRAKGSVLWIPRSLRVPLHSEELPAMLHLDEPELEIVRKLFEGNELKSARELVNKEIAKEDFLARAKTSNFTAAVPAELRGTLAPARIHHGNADGWFGVDPLQMSTFWGLESASKDARAAQLKIFIAERALGRGAAASPLPGVSGLVNLHLNVLDDNGRALRPDASKQLEAIIEAYVEHALTNAFTDDPLDMHGPARQGFLRALISWGAPDVSQSREEPWSTLFANTFLHGPDASKVSLAALLASAERAGFMAFTDRGDLAHHWEGPTIANIVHERAFAERVTPYKTKDVTPQLVQRALDAQLEDRAPTRKLELSSTCVHEVEFEVQVGERRFRGRAGIPADPPGRARAQTELMRGQRLIETLRPTEGPPIQVVIDGDFALAQVDRVKRDATYEAVVGGIGASHAQLLSALLPSLQDPLGNDFDFAHRWFWELVAVHADAELDANARATLSLLPLFHHEVDGTRTRTTAKALAEHFADEGSVPCYWPPLGGVPPHPPDFVHLPEKDIVLTARVFSLRLKDRSRDWFQHVKWFSDRPPMKGYRSSPLPETPHAMVKRSFDGVDFALWLSDPDDDFHSHLVQVCHDGRVVEQRQVFPPMMIGGLVLLDERRGRWLSGPPTTPELDLEIGVATLDLVKEAIDAAQLPDAPQGLRRRLAVLRRRIEQSEDWDLRQLAFALDQTPLHEVDGEWVDQEELERRERFEARRLATLRVQREEGAVQALANKQAAQLFRIEERAQARAAAAAASLPPHRPEPEPAPVPVEARLLETIRTELRHARAGAGSAYKDVVLDALHVDKGRGKRPVEVGGGSCFIDQSNVLVQVALAQEELSPALVTLLASAAASALNEWLDKVTETHELAMCLHLVQRAQRG